MLLELAPPSSLKGSPSYGVSILLAIASTADKTRGGICRVGGGFRTPQSDCRIYCVGGVYCSNISLAVHSLILRSSILVTA